MARWNGKGLSPEEKEQRKEALRQQVEDVVNNFETSPETILNYLKFSSRFHQYSVNNTILIYEQNSMAHFCASYKAFQDMGYQVQKGEVGMKIFVPYISTFWFDEASEQWNRLADASKEIKEKIRAGEIQTKQHTTFGIGTVFDIGQTDCPPEDYPKVCDMGFASESHARLFNALVHYAESRNISVNIKSLPSITTRGYYNRGDNSITLSDKLNDSMKLSVMSHELAHAIMHGSEDAAELSTFQKEIEADSLSLMFRQHLGVTDVEDVRQKHLQDSYKQYIDLANSSNSGEYQSLSEILENVNNAYLSIVDDFNSSINNYLSVEKANEMSESPRLQLPGVGTSIEQKNEANKMLRSTVQNSNGLAGLQLPGENTSIDYIDIIQNNSENVNGKNLKQEIIEFAREDMKVEENLKLYSPEKLTQSGVFMRGIEYALSKAAFEKGYEITVEEINEMKYEVLGLKEQNFEYDSESINDKPAKLTLKEYLAQRGLSSPVSDFMVDKMRIPHGLTQRQEDKLNQEAINANEEYHLKREAAITEYNEKVANGEIVQPSNIERYIKKATGNPEVASVQAARRALEKRGYVQNDKGEWVRANNEMNESFAEQYESWDKRNNVKVFNIGFAGNALKSVGVGDRMIQFDSKKLINVRAKHPEMTDSVIKQLPNIINDPLVIMDSKVANRIICAGELTDEKGSTVITVLELDPKDRRGNSLDVIKVTSAYGKEKFQNMLNNSRIRYISQNEKRISNWRLTTGLQLPFVSSITNSTSIISDNSENVNGNYKESYKNEEMNMNNEAYKGVSSAPYIVCEWSEHNDFKDGKRYELAEFDRLMKEADENWVFERAAEIERNGSFDKAIKNDDCLHQGYAKTKFTLYMPDGTSITERQDIGDGEGGVIDFLRQFPKYEAVVAQLDKFITSASTERSTSPFISEYFKLQNEYPDNILFSKLGDFYEVMGDNAKVAAEELDLVLTGRTINADTGERIAMCGVPAHTVESYVSRLVDKGYSVSLAESGEIKRVLLPGTQIAEAEKRIFVDMDGTLAEWNYVETERLYEEGYYRNLEPNQQLLDDVKSLIANGENVYVLSAYLTDSEYALQEKKEWLQEHLPELPEERQIFVPYGTNKAEFLKDNYSPITQKDFLVDDYTKNLNEWQEYGGVGIKYLNGINHTKGTWQGLMIAYDKEKPSLTDVVLNGEQASYQLLNNQIRLDMSEEQRARVLKDKTMDVVINNVDELSINYIDYENKAKSKIEKPLKNKMKELGVFKEYNSNAIDIDFQFTSGGFNKSLNSQISYGGSFSDFAKVLVNLDELLNKSVLIETHTDKAAGTPLQNHQLKQVYVLSSALAENSSIIPVQFEVMEYKNNSNRLYLTVALGKIKEVDVLGNTANAVSEGQTSLLSTSNIMITQLFENINPVDSSFLKYIPNEFLNEEQINAKTVAIQKEERKYGKTKPSLENEKNADEMVVLNYLDDSNELPVDILCDENKIEWTSFASGINNVDKTKELLQSVQKDYKQVVAINNVPNGCQLVCLDNNLNIFPFNDTIYMSPAGAMTEVYSNDNISKLVDIDTLSCAAKDKELMLVSQSDNSKYPFVKVNWSENAALRDREYMNYNMASKEVADLNETNINTGIIEKANLTLFLDGNTSIQLDISLGDESGGLTEHLNQLLQENSISSETSLQSLKSFLKERGLLYEGEAISSEISSQLQWEDTMFEL